MPPKNQDTKDWKLRLRYGQISTPYTHSTALIDVEVSKPTPENGAKCIGPAWLGIKLWATGKDKACDMADLFAHHFDCEPREIHPYDTPPEEPPRENPYGYGLTLTSYQDKKMIATNTEIHPQYASSNIQLFAIK